MPNTMWKSLPDQLFLNEKEVHTWWAEVPSMISQIDALKAVLSSEEKVKADRYYFERDHNFFVIARGLLRIAYGAYTNCDPRSVVFAYNEYGKPYIEEFSFGGKLFFNVSHSGEMVMLAFTRETEIGIDVEIVKDFKSAQDIINRFFSEEEKEVFIIVPGIAKSEVFFTYWVYKEAYIKALGKGMSYSLDSFTVNFIAGDSASIIDKNHQDNEKWVLRELILNNKYKSALAINSPGMHYSYWKITPDILTSLLKKI